MIPKRDNVWILETFVPDHAPITLRCRIFFLTQITPTALIVPNNEDVNGFAEFPRDPSPSIPLIAPLWANFRPLTISYRVAEDADTLQQVTDMIAQRNPQLRGYQPSLAVVVTVENAEPSFNPIQVLGTLHMHYNWRLGNFPRSLTRLFSPPMVMHPSLPSSMITLQPWLPYLEAFRWGLMRETRYDPPSSLVVG